MNRDKHGCGFLFTGDEKDVTQDVAADLLAWSYSDHETGQADEISLTLKDPEGKWAQSWRPDGGETIRMYLSARHSVRARPGALLRNFLC